MTFVTLGNPTQPFNRLLEAIKALVADNTLPRPVLVQSGATRSFSCTECEIVPLLSPADFDRAMVNAKVVIGHAGAGTIINALRAGHCPIVMPRERRYGEMVDDHQGELVKALAAEGLVYVASSVQEIRTGVAVVQQRRGHSVSGSNSRLLDLVSRRLDELILR